MILVFNLTINDFNNEYFDIIAWKLLVFERILETYRYVQINDYF